jgi:hypothetical protein
VAAATAIGAGGIGKAHAPERFAGRIHHDNLRVGILDEQRMRHQRDNAAQLGFAGDADSPVSVRNQSMT